MVKIQPADGIVQKIVAARNECFLAAAEGNYKKYKDACKNSAKLTLENYEVASRISTPKLTVPLFSSVGLNMLKVMILNLFRRKTPEEKQLKILKYLKSGGESIIK